MALMSVAGKVRLDAFVKVTGAIDEIDFFPLGRSCLGLLE